MDFNIEGNDRSDGLVRFTCADLPGFRLLLPKQTNREEYTTDLKQALTQFLPLYMVHASQQTIGILFKEEGSNGSRGQGLDLVARIAV